MKRDPGTSDAFDSRLEAYLAGELSIEETARFEQELADPEVSAALGAELFLRDFLATTGPGEPPAGLTDRIETALQEEGLFPAEEGSEGVRPDANLAVAAASWAVQGPAMALSGTGAPEAYGAREALAGMGTMRYALGPLANPKPRRRKKKALWRRAWSLARRVG